MEYNTLGKTGMPVSRLCFGSLGISPLQSQLSIDEGAQIMMEAFKSGVNFIDTAEFYNNYAYIKRALKFAKSKIVVASKSYAYTYEGMRASVDRARREMDLDVVDIFMLHEQESRLTLKGHREALECLLDAKAKGIINAVGVSTHTVEVVDAVSEMNEIDVIHPIINIRGIGIKDGNIKQMEKAIEKAYRNGKGIYGMKCLGGGNLINMKESAFNYILKFPYIHSVAVGMKTYAEVKADCLIFEGKTVPEYLAHEINVQKRKLIIEDWCRGCGQCAQHCKYKALSIVNGKSLVDEKKCILCGYCAGYCPDFCIKII
ncbi:MAG: aldo/keto reductase [Tepidanaerobacteraceae bacterium]|jgi:aryl-alcohol dehydrogenase-like predicted oxidoreductase|nr:aldo/keto reductase [Tepidanaerobacteraceae bacterium]